MADPVTLAADVSKQLITLATGVLALMLTYANGAGRKVSLRARRALLGAAGVFLVSVALGVATLMALVGQLAAMATGEPGAGIYAANVRLIAILQILLFLVGLGLTVRFGWLCLSDDAGGDSDGEGSSHEG